MSKRKKTLLLTWLKNELLFYRLLLKKRKFLAFLNEISLKYIGQKIKHDFTDSVHRFSNRHNLVITRMDVLRVHDTEEFLKAVGWFLTQYKLGREWEDAIITFVITGKLIPPVINLCIARESKRRYQDRVILTLNPDTSLADIRSALPEIKKMQKESWPGFRGSNLTEKSRANLESLLKIIRIKNLPSEKLSAYEQALLKAGYDRNTIQKYRKESGSKQKSIILRKTDAEAIREITGVKTQKELQRLVNKFRKARERI